MIFQDANILHLGNTIIIPETKNNEFTPENSNGLKDKQILLGQFRPIFKGELLVSW